MCAVAPVHSSVELSLWRVYVSVYRKYPKVRYISMIAKEIDTKEVYLELDVCMYPFERVTT